MPYEIEIEEGQLGEDDELTTLIGGRVKMNGVEYRLISADIYGGQLWRRTDVEAQ